MLVTDRARVVAKRDLVDVVAEAAAGGVGIVQVRESDLPASDLRRLVERIVEAVPPRTQVLVNGEVELARAMNVGLHMPARGKPVGSLAPRDAPYGRSVHDELELRAAVADGASYLLAGTVFETASKPGRRAAGLALVERICRIVHPMPVFAIGGISVSRVPPVIHSGAHGVAVCSAILSSREPGRIAEALDLSLRVAVRVHGAKDH
jgi:thiamine-phosphate pyrophosphorylase